MTGTPPPALVGLCHGVVWSGRVPHLALVSPDGTGRAAIPLTGRRLGLRVLVPGRFCLGHTALRGTGKGHQSCPSSEPARGTQCEACAGRDEFRFAHHAHRGGHVPAALQPYLAQRHWVYVATFADATSKVGTAAGPRKTERLDEQGAVAATYVAHVPTGIVARVFEDAVTAGAGLSQAVRSSAKAAALARPADPGALQAAHAAAVTAAEAVLAGEAGRAGVVLPGERWQPPPAHAALFTGRPGSGWPRYPHELAAGDHGLDVIGAVGAVVLARWEPAGAAHLVDLSALRGRRVALGPYVSAPALVQGALF